MVASAYDLSDGLVSWFARIVSTFRPHLEDGLGAFGVISKAESNEVLHVQLDGAPAAYRTLIHLGPVIRFHEHVPRDFIATTASQVLGTTRLAKIVKPLLSALRSRDSCGLHGPDGTGNSVALCAPRKELGPARPFEHRLARSVLPHVAAALRLRRSLTGLGLETASAEAVFDRNGRCKNAQGMGAPGSARAVLRSAVLRMERQRGRSSDDPESAREALIEGRWSLVDRFESGGRRFIVAYRNPPGVLDPRRLSPRERDVAVRIAQGMSHAGVAAELGISASTVGSVAMAVVNKLGLGSARELPLFWRDAAGCPVALGREEAIAIEEVAPPAAVPQLTPAEREVLEDVIRGGSNREIAARRRASVRTVANQVAGLLKKLGAASRLELAAKSPWDERGRA